MIAFYYLLVLFSQEKLPTVLLWFFSILLPLIGIVVAVALLLIVIRERKWQAWYVQQIRDLPTQLAIIVPPTDKDPVDHVNKLPIGYTSTVIIGLVVAIIVFWVFVFFTGHFMNIGDLNVSTLNQQ